MANNRLETFQALIDAGELEIGDGYRAKNSELGGNGLMFLRAGHVTDTHIEFAGTERFHERLEGRLLAKLSRPGDTIVTTKGNSTGRTSFVTDSMPTFVYSPHLSYWRSLNLERVCPGYLRYWSRCREFTSQLAGMKASTDMAPYLSLTDQRRLLITLPPIGQQRQTANILGALDDKIELNRQTNETLHAMTQTLFKSWFVDFDPVREKADGRVPVGMDSSTARLFPSTLEDSTWGQIPKGWRVEKIKALTSSIQYGLTQSASLENVGPHFLRITDIQGGEVDWSSVPYCRIDLEDVEKYRIRPGDIFVARTGASTGENIYVTQAPDAVFASYLVRFQFSDAGISRIVGCYMRTSGYADFVAGAIGGSAQPNASAQVLASAQLVVPPVDLAERFYAIVKPFDELRFRLDQANGELIAIRDTLIPVLLSSENLTSPTLP